MTPATSNQTTRSIMREIIRAITAIGPFIVQIILGRKRKRIEDEESDKDEK